MVPLLMMIMNLLFLCCLLSKYRIRQETSSQMSHSLKISYPILRRWTAGNYRESLKRRNKRHISPTLTNDPIPHRPTCTVGTNWDRNWNRNDALLPVRALTYGWGVLKNETKWWQGRFRWNFPNVGSPKDGRCVMGGENIERKKMLQWLTFLSSLRSARRCLFKHVLLEP